MSESKPRDTQHSVDNMVITCMDHRFQRIIGQLLKDKYQVDIEASDRLAYPGASMAVADGTLIPSIETSCQLHEVKSVWLVDHIDCGGFGGLKYFNNDELKEAEAHFETIAKATEALNKVLPELVVTSFVVTLDGESLQP